MNIPKDKNYPPDSVQCDDCGGHGCNTCGDKGWLTPATNPKGRKCEYAPCSKPLSPDHVAIYCTDDCAFNDA